VHPEKKNYGRLNRKGEGLVLFFVCSFVAWFFFDGGEKYLTRLFNISWNLPYLGEELLFASRLTRATAVPDNL